MPNFISNTSPIQYLYQTNLLELLPQLYGNIILPQGVVIELAEGHFSYQLLVPPTQVSSLKY